MKDEIGAEPDGSIDEDARCELRKSDHLPVVRSFVLSWKQRSNNSSKRRQLAKEQMKTWDFNILSHKACFKMLYLK